VVEKGANGAAVIETLSKSIPGVVPQVPVGSKEQRAASVLPTIESGACYLPEQVPWIDEFVSEFSGFGGAARHDDSVDAALCANIA